MSRPPARSRRLACAALPLVAALTVACGQESDEPTAGGGGSCLAGETLTFVVPYTPGGGYDTIARAAAPSLETTLDATVVIENQPGAGGLTAANTLFAGEPDGTVFAILPGVGILGSALAGVEGASFDPLAFTFIARVAPDVRLLALDPSSGLASIQDVRDAGAARFASTGPGGADFVDATVVSEILGIEGEVVSGFSGSAETALAVTRGDVDGVFSSVAGLLNGVQNGDLVPVLIAGDARSEDVPEVPHLLELDLDAEQQALAEAHARLQQAGRSIVAPPGVPADCAQELQDAFETAVEDPAFLELLEGSNERVEFLPGQDLQEIYRSVLEDSPAEYVALLESAFQGL